MNAITHPTVASHTVSAQTPPRITLVLQGGGALGAYQAGVYEAMHEAGLKPDWVIGTSIGAINGSLIAGNRPDRRLERLRAFWKRVEHGFLPSFLGQLPFGTQLANWMTMANGIEGFFTPNHLAFASPTWPLGSQNAGYYNTAPLRRTLTDLVDFDLINTGGTRLTVGAANVRSAMMHYFDSRDRHFDARHIMASGALPPAFPPVLIDGEMYWDGGILSNTPVEAVFDDYPRRSGLVFVVHIWNPNGRDPETIAEVTHRQKDVQYASRAHSHIVRQKQLHRMRHIIAELAARLPDAERAKPEVEDMAGYGCLTQMHVVRLLAPGLEGEDGHKDIDFSPAGIAARWRAGYENTRAVIARAPWLDPVDPLEGFVLHEARGAETMETVAV
ncbi:MAG: patatin-like phospholipase family protein [Acetobacteraceae bacterium]|nr:patatin-like phospholipase family protein [Pseudomonadota bacterium]